MKVVLDTNVLISGIFFRGPPARILQAWRDQKLRLVISPEILDEYLRVANILSQQYRDIDIDPIIALITQNATMVTAPKLSEMVCDDPDDDKFLACALISKAKFVVSGDKALQRVSEYRGVQILSPTTFVDQFLS